MSPNTSSPVNAAETMTSQSSDESKAASSGNLSVVSDSPGGFNTTLVVMNDRLQDIANDPEFGKALATAIAEFGNSTVRPYPTGHGVYIIEQHGHELASVLIATDNKAECLMFLDDPKDAKQQIMRALAKELGYRIVKLPDTPPLPNKPPPKKKK